MVISFLSNHYLRPSLRTVTLLEIDSGLNNTMGPLKRLVGFCNVCPQELKNAPSRKST